MGGRLVLIFQNVGGNYSVQIVHRIYASGVQGPDHSTKFTQAEGVLLDSRVYDFTDLAAMQTTHYVEFGRVAGGGENFIQRYNFWDGKGPLAASHVTPDKAHQYRGSATRPGRISDGKSGYTLITSPEGINGHCGFTLKSIVGSAGEWLRMDEFVVQPDFLTYDDQAVDEP